MLDCGRCFNEQPCYGNSECSVFSYELPRVASVEKAHYMIEKYGGASRNVHITSSASGRLLMAIGITGGMYGHNQSIR